jgi:CDP-diacylglycerol--serine O-phosphatidyltransferase
LSPKVVKKKLTKSGRWRKRQEAKKKGLALLPSLLTLGNAICGIAAIIKVAKIQVVAATLANPERFDYSTNIYEAAWLILAGMVFDVLDGRVARMTKMTSDFGAQLDSLSDAITFGVAPGILTIMANAEARFPEHPFWTKVAWTFGIAYACGAISRLARFNVETEDHSEKAHLEFKGLPSPAAAGVIATLTLLQGYLWGPRAERSLAWVDHGLVTNIADSITFVLPFAALTLGYLMVSKFRYAHVANRYLKGRKPFSYLGLILVSGVLMSLVPEVMLALIFIGYAFTGPLLAWRLRNEPPALDASAASEAPATLTVVPNTTTEPGPSSAPPTQAPPAPAAQTDAA